LPASSACPTAWRMSPACGPTTSSSAWDAEHHPRRTKGAASCGVCRCAAPALQWPGLAPLLSSCCPFVGRWLAFVGLFWGPVSLPDARKGGSFHGL
jgi:hypothetical protein